MNNEINTQYYCSQGTLSANIKDCNNIRIKETLYMSLKFAGNLIPVIIYVYM